MSRKLLVALAVMGIAFAGSTFAAVENIKVSGDATIYAVNRSDYHLGSALPGLYAVLGPVTNGGVVDDDISVLASVTRLRFDADLTEDVSATVVLNDERVWGLQADDIYASEAYVSLKNVLESPLSVKIGLQPVKLGIISLSTGDFGGGGAAANSATNFYANTNSAFQEGMLDDLSPRKHAAAITANLDLDPFVIDAGFIKYDENTVAASAPAGVDNDTNVYFLNLAYLIEGMRAFEVYYLVDDTQDAKSVGREHNIQNIGLRMLATPIPDLLLIFEGCYQAQKEDPFKGGRDDGDRQSAWATILAAKYTFRDFEWMPNILGSIAFLSPKWDSMYEDASSASIVNALTPGSNCRAISLTFGARPMDDVDVKIKWLNVYFQDPMGAGNMSNIVAGLGLGAGVPNSGTLRYIVGKYATWLMTDDKEFCNEVNLKVTYDYSEDVQLSLETDWFMPGDAFDSTNDETAFQALGTMKVTF
jgi:hypothetical protein